MKERLPQLARCVDRFTMHYIASSFSQNSPAIVSSCSERSEDVTELSCVKIDQNQDED